MRMILVMAALMCAGLSYGVETTSFQPDPTAALSQAKSEASARGTVPIGVFIKSDCQQFVFETDSPALCAPRDFRSETWVEECDDIPMPNPPGGVCIPRRRLLSVDQRTVTVDVPQRVVPGPKEIFTVCLAGPSIHLKVKQSPHQYKVQEKAEPPSGVVLVLTQK